MNKVPFAGLIAVLIIIASLQQYAHADKIDSFSFEPPFRDIDSSGLRLVSHDWRASGSTMVNSNFARLTPDQQSKTGALWSREMLDVPSFSSTLKFRISGKGKDLYGDGIAVWIVQQGYFIEGDLHGFQEDFIGVGIIFDTFRNTENLMAHRDVTVLINDGDKTWAMMTEDVKVLLKSYFYLILHKFRISSYVYLLVYLSACLSVRLSAYLFVCWMYSLPICLSVCLQAWAVSLCV